jgi:hypothetical protein
VGLFAWVAERIAKIISLIDIPLALPLITNE